MSLSEGTHMVSNYRFSDTAIVGLSHHEVGRLVEGHDASNVSQEERPNGAPEGGNGVGFPGLPVDLGKDGRITYGSRFLFDPVPSDGEAEGRHTRVTRFVRDLL